MNKLLILCISAVVFAVGCSKHDGGNTDTTSAPMANPSPGPAETAPSPSESPPPPAPEATPPSESAPPPADTPPKS
jgi:hypothetical protein